MRGWNYHGISVGFALGHDCRVAEMQRREEMLYEHVLLLW